MSNRYALRVPLFLMLFLISLSTLCAVGHKEELDTLTVEAAVFSGPSGFGMVKLLEEAPYLGEGVKSSIRVLPGPQEMVARVSTGEIDIAVFPSNLAAKLYNAGPGYPMAAVVGFGLLHLVSRDASITSWGDVRGKNIYSLGKGASPEYLLRYFLSEAGIDADKGVEIDFSIAAGPQLAQAVIGKKVDHAVLAEPFATLALSRDPDLKRVISFQESWQTLHGGEGASSYPITVVVVSPDLAENHPEVAARFLEAYRDSIEWVSKNPKEAALLIEKHDIMAAAVAEPAIPECNLGYLSAAEGREIMETYLQVLLNFDPQSVGGKLPDHGFYLE